MQAVVKLTTNPFVINCSRGSPRVEIVHRVREPLVSMSLYIVEVISREDLVIASMMYHRPQTFLLRLHCKVAYRNHYGSHVLHSSTCKYTIQTNVSLDWDKGDCGRACGSRGLSDRITSLSRSLPTIEGHIVIRENRIQVLVIRAILRNP